MSSPKPFLSKPFLPLLARRARNIPLLGLALALLGGCASPDRIIANPAPEPDYRARHPIALAEGRQSLALYLDGFSLDARARAQIRRFAQEARAARAPGLLISAPRAQSRQAAQIRRALEAAAAPGPIETLLFLPAVAPSLRATPITLSFRTLVARAPAHCGQWPEDLASGGTLDGWRNQPWWNYGCATQTMLAVQVADPRDLAGPAAESPPDAPLRQHAFDALRQGKDPTVTWTTQNNPTNGSGSGP